MGEWGDGVVNKIYFDPRDDVDEGDEIIKPLIFNDDEFRPLSWFKIKPNQVEPVIFPSWEAITEPAIWVDDDGSFEGVDGLL